MSRSVTFLDGSIETLLVHDSYIAARRLGIAEENAWPRKLFDLPTTFGLELAVRFSRDLGLF